jgi:DNA-binding XRE family transcriptional regulator
MTAQSRRAAILANTSTTRRKPASASKISSGVAGSGASTSPMGPSRTFVPDPLLDRRRIMLFNTPRDLGAAIRERRKALGWDQVELAARVGARRRWLIQVENGSSGPLSDCFCAP